MDSDYVFLCGVMWCAYGQREAGKELLRATSSGDPDVSSLACALLVRGIREIQRTLLGTPGVEKLDHINADEVAAIT